LVGLEEAREEVWEGRVGEEEVMEGALVAMEVMEAVTEAAQEKLSFLQRS
jgi:hypothetical protein